MAGVLISPKIDIKIRNRDAAYKKKFGSPNYRDILRERCRQRIKARRGALFDHLRPLSSEEEVRSALSDMMRSDVKEITTNKMLLENEVVPMDTTSQFGANLDDKDLWIEYEDNEESSKEESYLMKIYEQILERDEALITLLEDELFCPLCEKGIFNNNSGILTCTQCPAVLHSTASPSHIKHLINSGLTTHDQFCSERVQFAIFPEDAFHGLFMICETCAYFIQIV